MFSYNTWWGYRTPDKRSETIPSSRITPDPLYSSSMTCFFSSVHLTHLLQASGQRTEMTTAEAWFCAQWPIFEVCVWIMYGLKIQTWPIIRFLTESVTYSFLICWFDKISDALCLNKMSRTSSRNIGPQHHKYSSIFHCTHGYYLSLCSPNPSWVFAAKKLIFFSDLTIEASPILISVVSDNWICWSLFLDDLG